MNIVQVIVNDYEGGVRMTMLFRPEEFNVIDEHWEQEDTLLRDLQFHRIFKGRTRWCDLSPTHFRIMIANNLSKVAELPAQQREDFSNPVMLSLNSLIAGLVRCIEKRGECMLETLRIHRVSDGEVAFDYSASLSMVVDFSPEEDDDPSGGIRVIVDNTGA